MKRDELPFDWIDLVLMLTAAPFASRGGLLLLLCAALLILQYAARHHLRAYVRAFTDEVRGITPAAPQTPARTLAHRSEPLDQLSITVTPEQAQRIVSDATIALPAAPALHVDVPESGAPLMLDQVLQYINKQPNIVPHLAIIGASGTGKTTFGTATLHDREGQIVVITAKEGDTWGGLPYIGIDDDATYTTANETFRALAADMRRRLVAVKKHQSPGVVLNVVLDDYSTLRKLCASADDFFLLAARLGRSLCVRLIVLSDSALVKSWGIEGEGETRANFAFVRLARGRKGTLETEDGERPFMTTFILEIARLARLGPRAWQRPRPAVEMLAEYLGVSPEELSSVSPTEPGSAGSLGVAPSEPAEPQLNQGSAGSAVHPPVYSPTLPTNRTELAHLMKALTLFQQNGKETEAIEQAFGVTKGGSAAYQHARNLFKTAQEDT